MPDPGVAQSIPPGRLLVVAPDRLDDACLSVPAIRAIARIGTVEHLHVLCSESQSALWRGLPGIDTLTCDDRSRPRSIRSAITGSGTSFAAALLWERSPASRAVAAAGIAPRFGLADQVPERDLTDALALARPPGPIEHRVRDFLLAAEALGAKPFDPANFEPVTLGVAADPGRLAVIPDSDFGPSHQWPRERWTELLRKTMAERRVTVVDRGIGPLAGELAASLGNDASLERPPSLSAELELLARHRIVAAADGSAAHLAAHVGATCLVIFGPNEPAWRRPLGKRHRILRRHVACSPCFLPKCPLDHRCMKELESSQVLESLTALIDA